MVGRRKSKPAVTGRAPKEIPKEALENTIKRLMSLNLEKEVLKKYEKYYDELRKLGDGFEEVANIWHEQTPKMINEIYNVKEKYIDVLRRLIDEKRLKWYNNKIFHIVGAPLSTNGMLRKDFITLKINKYLEVKRVHINVLNVLDEEAKRKLRYLRTGLFLSDGAYHKGIIQMSTAYIWQAVLFTILYGIDTTPSVGLGGLTIKKDDVNLIFYVEAYDYNTQTICGKENSKECKKKILVKMKEMNKEELITLLCGHWIGDGTGRGGKRQLTFVDKLASETIAEKLKELGYDLNTQPDNRVILSGESAAKLAKEMLLSIDHNVLEIMKKVPDDLKALELLKEISTYSRRKILMVDLGSVNIRKSHIVFVKNFMDEQKAQEWIKKLRRQYNIEPVSYRDKYGRIMVKVLADESMKLICCNEGLRKQIIEKAKKSRSRGASKWSDENEWRKYCYEKYPQCYEEA